MSLSRPTGTKNPAKKFIEFKNGKFSFYDKENKKNIELEFPFRFIVCDELACISGFSDRHQCGISSNEVRNITEDTLNVRYRKGGTIASGKYQEIKPQIVEAGGRYTKSIYAVVEGELVNIKLAGAALSAWIEKPKGESAWVVNGVADGKKGATKYQFPVFEPDTVPESSITEATKIDQDFQTYLDGRKPINLDAAGTEEEKKAVAGEVEESIEINDSLPF